MPITNWQNLIPEARERAEKPCYEYSDDPGALSVILADPALTIDVREVGPKRADPKTFKRGEMHYLYEVTITRGKKETRFDYHGSVQEWLNREGIKNWQTKDESRKKAIRDRDYLVYSVLSCIRSEYHCPDTWEDYKSEFGGESHEEYVQWERWAKQAGELRAIFTAKEIEAFPG